MWVTLLQSTKDAIDLLIFTKRTRLRMEIGEYQRVKLLTEWQKLKELEYIFGTISSSWEFVDYVFLIESVTRAFTHQLVRHRVGVSFAQQAMRVVDASNFDYLSTGSCRDSKEYHRCMQVIKESYAACLNDGAHPQDARGLLPTNVLTNIVMKINLRALSGLLNIRLCFKAQGEFQRVARAMRKTVLGVHPWAAPVLQVNCVQHGFCAFPNYKECPIKRAGLLPTADRVAIESLWEENMVEAQPVGDNNE